LLRYVPDNKEDSTPYIEQLEKDDWVSKLKKKIEAFNLDESKSDEDKAKEGKDLESDLDYLNVVLLGTDDKEPFVRHELAKSI